MHVHVCVCACMRACVCVCVGVHVCAQCISCVIYITTSLSTYLPITG